MGSWVGKYLYSNRGWVAVAVTSITLIGISRVTVPNISLPIKEPKEYIGNGSKRSKCWQICFQPQRWLEWVIRGRGWRGTSKNDRAFRKGGVCLMLYWCRPLWKCNNKAFSCWNIVFVHSALIKSLRNRQNTVESSTFGSEVSALRIARDMIMETIIKLKMFGVPLASLENVFCDNNRVVKDTSTP